MTAIELYAMLGTFIAENPELREIDVNSLQNKLKDPISTIHPASVYDIISNGECVDTCHTEGAAIATAAFDHISPLRIQERKVLIIS